MSKSLPRRTVLKAALMGGAALPLMARLTEAEAAAALPLIDVNDPVAKSLGYIADSSKVDAKANPTHKPNQKCTTCIQYQGKAADKQAGCNLFPGKAVAGAGWCKVWAQKPGT